MTKKFLKVILWIFISMQLFSIGFATTWKFDYSMDKAITPIRTNIDPATTIATTWWGESIQIFIFNLFEKIVIPLAISAWIVVWMIWAYKLLFSSDEKQVSTWLKMVIFGVIWIILMVSAKYIWSVIFETIFQSWNVSTISWIELSKAIYDKIAYPFIKIALYLALAIIFIVLVGKSISLITKTDGSNQKTAIGMIWRCAISILIIIGAKNIVEAIYWKQNEVFVANAQTFWDIWTWILADKNIPILYNIITRALSIIWLVILILLIIQWFKILINPSKAENFQKLWKNILYTVIWLFIIGIVYLLANTFILN